MALVIGADFSQNTRPQPHASISFPERCRSGRTGLTRNQVTLQGVPGFESLPLRHIEFHDCLITQPDLQCGAAVLYGGTTVADSLFAGTSSPTGCPAPIQPSISFAATRSPAT